MWLWEMTEYIIFHQQWFKHFWAFTYSNETLNAKLISCNWLRWVFRLNICALKTLGIETLKAIYNLKLQAHISTEQHLHHNPSIHQINKIHFASVCLRSAWNEMRFFWVTSDFAYRKKLREKGVCFWKWKYRWKEAFSLRKLTLYWIVNPTTAPTRWKWKKRIKRKSSGSSPNRIPIINIIIISFQRYSLTVLVSMNVCAYRTEYAVIIFNSFLPLNIVIITALNEYCDSYFLGWWINSINIAVHNLAFVMR